MGVIGASDDWVICAGCGWSSVGTWAYENAHEHAQANEPDSTHWCVIGGTSDRHNCAVDYADMTDCAACELVAYFNDWLEFTVKDQHIWEDTAVLWDFQDGWEDAAVEASQEALGEPVLWFGMSAPRPHHVAYLLPHIACTEHRATHRAH